MASSPMKKSRSSMPLLEARWPGLLGSGGPLEPPLVDDACPGESRVAMAVGNTLCLDHQLSQLRNFTAILRDVQRWLRVAGEAKSERSESDSLRNIVDTYPIFEYPVPLSLMIGTFCAIHCNQGVGSWSVKARILTSSLHELSTHHHHPFSSYLTPAGPGRLRSLLFLDFVTAPLSHLHFTLIQS